MMKATAGTPSWRHPWLGVPLLVAVACCLVAPSRAFAADYLIRVGTVVGKASPWGKVFEAWKRAVADKSGGRMALRMYYYTTTGSDEASIIRKVKAGQFQGAAVSGVGLSKVYKPILALQMPGLYGTWAQLDKARAGMNNQFVSGVTKAGFTHVGWYDIGLRRRMSKGIVLKTPADLKGKKPFRYRDDVNEPNVHAAIGGVTGVPLSTQEVLPNLNTGATNAVNVPSLFAEQMQWSGKLDTMVSAVTGVVIGGIVLSTTSVNALPNDLRAILLDTGKTAANSLTTRIRKQDAEAFVRLKGKMTVVVLSYDEKSKWDAIYKTARQRLSEGTFSPSLVSKLEGYR